MSFVYLMYCAAISVLKYRNKLFINVDLFVIYIGITVSAFALWKSLTKLYEKISCDLLCILLQVLAEEINDTNEIVQMVFNGKNLDKKVIVMFENKFR